MNISNYPQVALKFDATNPKYYEETIDALRKGVAHWVVSWDGKHRLTARGWWMVEVTFEPDDNIKECRRAMEDLMLLKLEALL